MVIAIFNVNITYQPCGQPCASVSAAVAGSGSQTRHISCFLILEFVYIAGAVFPEASVWILDKKGLTDQASR